MILFPLPTLVRHAAPLVAVGLMAAMVSLDGAKPAWAASGHDGHQPPVANPGGPLRTEAAYQVPRLTMVRQDGKKMDIRAAIDEGRPVMLNFIYTTCTAICPVTSQVFSQVQEKLGPDKRKLLMVSVTIDPEHDTPPRLAEFAKKFNAGPQWHHFTGTVEDSVALQKAFDAYRGDKMNHVPVTYLRAAPGKPWVRVEGLAGPDLLLKEYRRLLASS